MLCADGFEFAVLGDHEVDVDRLAARVRAEAEAEIGRCYLEPDPHGGRGEACHMGWLRAGWSLILGAARCESWSTAGPCRETSWVRRCPVRGLAVSPDHR